MTANLRPFATFRLYPERGTRYIVVNVWPTRAAMLDRLREIGVRGLRYTHGCCTAWLVRSYRGGRTHTSGLVAEVNLYRARLGMEIVTHELLHATLAYARRSRIAWASLDPDKERGTVSDVEEGVCYAHGRLCADFVRRAERAGLYDPRRWDAVAAKRAA